QARGIARRDRAPSALGLRPAPAATDHSQAPSRRRERVPKRVGPADDRGADHQDQPDPSPPDDGILGPKPSLLTAHPEGSSGFPGSPRRDPSPETRTEKTMADSPNWRATMVGNDPGTVTPINLTRPPLAPGRSD